MILLNDWNFEIQGRVITLARDGFPKITLECPSKEFANVWFQILSKLKVKITQNIGKHPKASITKKLSANLSSLKRKQINQKEITIGKSKVLTFGKGPSFCEFNGESIEKELFEENQEDKENGSNIKASSTASVVKEEEALQIMSSEYLFSGRNRLTKEQLLDTKLIAGAYSENKQLKSDLFKFTADKEEIIPFGDCIRKSFADFQNNNAFNLSEAITNILRDLMVF